MSRRLTCPMGHVWEGDRPHAESGGLKRFRCPTCSAEVVLAISDPNTAGTDPHQTIAEVPAGESPPGAPVVPGYQILEELGRGGMGVVYKARQLNLNRVVALKTVLAGGRHRPDELPRFRREAEAVAKLRSANIVQVYDIGTAGDLTYFTMEFIDGGTLAQAYATTRPTPRRAAELLEPLARAVHAAHQQGVIHRDLKPQNILITAEGTPKLADFGLAKMFGGGADLTPESRTAVLGTPAYAAPEQAMGQARTVGPPADVYGLGAVLYSLLTGAPPFKGETALHTLHLVMTEEPLSPTWFNPRVPRDLETICLKCLRKSPEQRYATAEELAADLRRFLAGEPIRARPTPTWERALKWARRHPAVFTGLTAALLGGLALAVGAFVYAEQEGQAARTAETLRGAAESERDRARTAEALAEANARTARRNQYAAKLELAYQEYSSGRPGRAREILLGQRRQSDWAELNGFAWHRLWRLCGIEPAVLRGHDGPLYKVAVAPDGKLAATGGRDQVIRLWDLATGRNVRELVGHIGSINNLEFSADGERLLGGSFSPDHQLDVRVWSASDGRELAGRRLEGAGVAAAFRPGGHDVTVAVSRNVASGGGQTTVTLWDEKLSQERELYREPSNYMTFAFAPGGRRLAVAATGYYIRVWDVAGPTPAEAWVSEFDLPNCLDYSRDGKWLAVGSGDSRGAAGKVQIRNAVTGAALRTLVGHTNSVVGVAFSPDGQTLASAGGDGLVVLWEVETGRVRETFRGHEGPVESVAFTPDGGTLISVGADGSARLWDCGRRHGQAATTVAWSPDGRTLASGGADHAVLFWDPTVGKVTAAGRGHAGPVVAVAFAPDGQVVASAGADGAVRLWEPATGALKATLVGHAGVVRAVGFAPDEAKLASGGDDGTVRLWKVKDGTATATLSGHVGPVHAVAFNPTARTLVTGGADGTVRFWDPEAGSQILQRGTKGRAVRCLWFAPDGLGLMAGLDDGALAYWAGAKWDPKPETKAHRAPVTAVTATTNGRLVASAGADGAVIVWDWANEAIVLNRTAPAGPALALAFAPDGRTLASAGGEPRLRFWDVESGSSRPLPAPPVGPLAAGDAWRAGADSELLDHDHGYVWRLAFSADGQGLAAAFGDQYDTRLAGDVKVWQLGAAGRPRALQGQTLGLSGLSFSPRGDTLASSSWDGSVLLRNAATGFERAKLTGHAGCAHAVAFAPDGSTLASAGADGTVRLWDAAARQPVAVLTGHAAAVFSLAWTPDGRILISGDRNGMVQFWDAAARKSLGAVKAHAGPVAALAVAPDGHSVASAGFDSRVHIWDLATHEEKLPEFIDSGEVVGAMAYSPDGKTLAVGFGSFQCVGRVRLWDLATRKVRLELAGHRNVVWSVAFSPDGRTLASAALDGTARTWDVATGRELHQWRGAGSELWAVAFRPDGRALALGGIDVTLRFVDPTDGRELAALNGHTGPMRGMAWSADGRVLATAGWLNRNGSVVRFWNPETGEETGQLRGTSDMLTAFAMTRDGRLAATGEQSTAEAIRVRLWDVAAQAEVAALAAHPTMQYKALAFSPDGRLLAAGRNDGTVQLWDVESRSCRVERVGHTGPVVSLAFAPDGATLASGGGGGRDYSVKIWNVADLTERVALHGHAADIWGVAFSPDGRTFATGSGDRTVRLWDPVTGQERAVLSGFPSPVSALAFAPDSRSLAVGGYSWVRVLHATRGDDVPMK